MDRRFEARLGEMMAQAEVRPGLLQDLLLRLDQFVQPFIRQLAEPAQRRHAAEYTMGLVSKLERKTGEGIAYLLDQDRQGLQKFIGQVRWDHQPLLTALVGRVGQELGEADGVIVFDPSAFPKKGDQSVGVGRQWCGRLGKIENCQVGVYMGYATRKEHALVNVRLYLPQEWAKKKKRRVKAGVPAAIKFQTRHQLALEMLEECGGKLPHTWIAGDDEMGRSSRFRLDLRSLGERYLLAVPSNTLIRDMEVPPPQYSGRGRYPKTPFVRVDHWCAKQLEDAWTKLDVRDGEKGPLVIEAVKRRVQARTDTGGTGPDEVLFVTRERQADKTYKLDYYLSSASAAVPLSAFGRVAKAAHRIEECIERGKGEAGLGDYQVRNWPGWHHHQTLSLLAAWFLNKETRRGKNTDPGSDVPAAQTIACRSDRCSPGDEPFLVAYSAYYPLVTTQRASKILSSLFAQDITTVKEPAADVRIQ
jgi:SRSO17 transposase